MHGRLPELQELLANLAKELLNFKSSNCMCIHPHAPAHPTNYIQLDSDDMDMHKHTIQEYRKQAGQQRRWTLRRSDGGRWWQSSAARGPGPQDWLRHRRAVHLFPLQVNL